MSDELYYIDKVESIDSTKPNHTIVIENNNGKQLILDFNTNKLKVSGDLDYDDAAKLFLDALKKQFNFFKESINEKD